MSMAVTITRKNTPSRKAEHHKSSTLLPGISSLDLSFRFSSRRSNASLPFLFCAEAAFGGSLPWPALFSVSRLSYFFIGASSIVFSIEEKLLFLQQSSP